MISAQTAPQAAADARTHAIATWDNPPAVAARGTLIVIAGRGEHPGVYERFGTRIAFDGYRVRAVGDPTTDADGVTARVRELLADDALPSPRVLVGSDTGALFAAAFVAGGSTEVNALILAGLPTTTADAAAVDQTWENGDWDDELAARTSCPTHQARLRADDRLCRGALSGEPPREWFAAADLAAVPVPILGVHGDSDAVSALERAREQYEKAPAAQLVAITGGVHDALNDATHRTVAATVVLFLERLKLGAHLPEIARRVV